MKKWQVLTAALFLAIVGGLRLLQQHKAQGAAALPPVHVLPGGQLLPEDTAQYYIPAEFLSVPPMSGAPSTYGALPTIKNEAYDRGLCAGGSLNAILSSHGRIWGLGSRHGNFTGKETAAVYGLLEQYLACVGLARGEPSFCDYLPGGNAAQKIEYFDSPDYACRKLYTDVAFPAFASGRTKSEVPCHMLLSGDSLSKGGRKLGPDFCSVAASGMEKICDSFSSRVDAETMGKCRRFLPGDKKDCGSDQDCLSRLAIYGAMKAGAASPCPESSRGLCAAALSGTESSCSIMLVNLGKVYCGYLESAQKRANGYAGLSPEEVKAAISEGEANKALEARRMIEKRMIEEEVNEKARKMLSK